ncbi:hypothetical protein HPB52_006813 [Rhipicephalus sanguineus]|uniref:Uncharacterized protein n=1 Tax=Rhipicephalus sanguineus TaxID=34632 RepID=A0A9D4QDF0_RHISA|nr:hypothetical protein HPB52_006813 [Rhipicephalus sanguineus]
MNKVVLYVGEVDPWQQGNIGLKFSVFRVRVGLRRRTDDLSPGSEIAQATGAPRKAKKQIVPQCHRERIEPPRPPKWRHPGTTLALLADDVRRNGYTLYNMANMDQTMVRIDNPANRTNNVVGESTIRIANTGCARRGFTVCLAACATGHKLPRPSLSQGAKRKNSSQSLCEPSHTRRE